MSSLTPVIIQADTNVTFMGDGVPHEAHISALNVIAGKHGKSAVGQSCG